MKKILLFLVMLLNVAATFASGFSAANTDGVTINYEITNVDDKTVAVTSGSTPYSGSVNIPSTVTNENTMYTVTSIYYSAFKSCSDLTSVAIPSSVTSILDYASHIVPN